MKTHLTQYQAAVLLNISPTLLEYLTKRTVKKDDPRKLQVAKQSCETLFFTLAELNNYNAWLHAPWPSEPKKRPHLPKAFKNEVMEEAGGECAICHKNGNSCEAAHITPVAQTRCNHPHNLLWLCANHHTKFDNGSLGPTGASNKLAKATKVVVQAAHRHVWQLAADVSSQLAALLKVAKDLSAQAEANPSEAASIEAVGKKLLELLPKVISKSTDKNIEHVLAKITAGVITQKGTAKSKSSTTQALATASSFEEEFLRDAGLKDCPLCEGTRWHNEHECPVCQGNGSIPEESKPDLSPFELVDCNLCIGKGHISGETCPACCGECHLEARIFEQIDWNGFDKLECTLCEGTGSRRGDECPVCNGDGEVERRILERVNLRDFDEVECPLCEGSGNYEYNSCRECGGDGYMPRHISDQVDVSSYEMEDCEICNGSGEFFEQVCRACGGEQRVTRGANESIDTYDFKLVNCPTCNGEGGQCCNWNCKIPRYIAASLED